MKICDLTQSYAATGGGVRTYIHAKRDRIRAGDEGHEHVLIVPGATDSVEREGRLTVRTIASPPVPGSGVYRMLLRSDKVLRALREESPDVVEVHCAYNLPWTALHFAGENRSARVVGVYMTDLPRAYVEPVARRLVGERLGGGVRGLAERYVRRLYRRMDATVAISPALATRLQGLGVDNVECIPLGVDLEVFHPSRRDPGVRRRLGVPEDAPLLVYAGRLDGEKRAALVVEAFQRLPPELGAALVLVGDGPLRASLDVRAATVPRLRVLPFQQDRAELARLLASADVYVSAMPYETFGLSVIEAQACGLPVVGVAGGAMVDRVPAGSGVGRLGPVDSVEGLRDNLVALLRDPDFPAAGRRARAMVEARFSWASTFARWFGLYETLLRSSPQPMSEPRQGALPSGLDKLFRTTLIIVPIGVLGNIVFSLLVTDRGLLTALHQFPREYLLLAVGLGLVPWVTNALRLLIWTRFLGYPLRFREALQMTLAVDLGSAVSPTAVGGGFFKWGMLVQRGVSPGAAASITTFPNIEDAIFFGIALPVAVVWTASWDLPIFREVAEQFQQNALTVVGVAGGIALFTWLAIRALLLGGLGTQTQRRSLHLLARARRRLRSTWVDASEVFRLIARNGKSLFALSLALTAVQWIARYSVVSALVAFLGAPVQPVLFWILQWVCFTLMSFVPTPGAAGGAEAIFFFIYSPFVPERVIGLATAGWRFLTFYLQLALASVLFFLLNVRSREAR